jgi:hypothetical protein
MSRRPTRQLTPVYAVEGAEQASDASEQASNPTTVGRSTCALFGQPHLGWHAYIHMYVGSA